MPPPQHRPQRSSKAGGGFQAAVPGDDDHDAWSTPTGTALESVQCSINKLSLQFSWAQDGIVEPTAENVPQARVLVKLRERGRQFGRKEDEPRANPPGECGSDWETRGGGRLGVVAVLHQRQKTTRVHDRRRGHGKDLAHVQGTRSAALALTLLEVRGGGSWRAHPAIQKGGVP